MSIENTLSRLLFETASDAILVMREAAREVLGETSGNNR